MGSLEKNKQIQKTLQETKDRRSRQICKVFEVKIDESHLNKVQKEYLKMIFVEAKWLYNDILRQEDIFKYSYKVETIQKMNKEHKLEEVSLNHLSSSVKQSIVDQTKQNIVNLSKAKKNKKVGRLKFKSEYNSINFKQNNVTHKVLSKSIKLQGLKKPVKVRGLKQIQENYEIANIKLVKRPTGYFILITTFHFPSKGFEQSVKKEAVGIDFGIKHSLTTSDGETFDVTIAESEQLKRKQRKFAKSKKGSNNRYRLRMNIRKDYQKMSNQKKDLSNKIVNYLTSTYHEVYIQDENLIGWKKWFGRQVQHSCMGTIKAKLRQYPYTTMIGRFLPTTKMCNNCGAVNETISLADRIFTCCCGYSEDRDIKAAKTIMLMGKINNKVGTERIDPSPKARMPVELYTASVLFCNTISVGDEVGSGSVFS